MLRNFLPCRLGIGVLQKAHQGALARPRAGEVREFLEEAEVVIHIWDLGTMLEVLYRAELLGRSSLQIFQNRIRDSGNNAFDCVMFLASVRWPLEKSFIIASRKKCGSELYNCKPGSSNNFLGVDRFCPCMTKLKL
jgi:hypothetical protein